jgi:hypothetical protein
MITPRMSAIWFSLSLARPAGDLGGRVDATLNIATPRLKGHHR